jgi:hypothetical protein
MYSEINKNFYRRSKLVKYSEININFYRRSKLVRYSEINIEKNMIYKQVWKEMK